MAIDDKVVQRFLYAISDKVAESVQGSDNQKGIIRLEPKSKKLGANQEIIALNNQQKIFSDSPLHDPYMAKALFRDREQNDLLKSGPLDTRYSISNNIIIFYRDTPWIFNIDRANQDNDKIYFSNLSIKNQSKDIFTLKANYKLNLKIHFTDFDDLLERNLAVTSILNPQYTISVSPIHLLYQYTDLKTSQMGKTAIDPNGLYFSQKLYFKPETPEGIFMRQALGESMMSKNYHLTYHKHVFDVFKSSGPIADLYDNELNIEYVAYETDGFEKPVSKALQKYVPKTNTNMMRLLDELPVGEDLMKAVPTFSTFKGMVAQVEQYNERLRQLNSNCKTSAVTSANNAQASKPGSPEQNGGQGAAPASEADQAKKSESSTAAGVKGTPEAAKTGDKVQQANGGGNSGTSKSSGGSSGIGKTSEPSSTGSKSDAKAVATSKAVATTSPKKVEAPAGNAAPQSPASKPASSQQKIADQIKTEQKAADVKKDATKSAGGNAAEATKGAESTNKSEPAKASEEAAKSDATKGAEAAKEPLTEEQKKAAQEAETAKQQEISAIEKSVQALVASMEGLLRYSILDSIDFYSMEVQNSVWPNYTTGNFLEAISENFSVMSLISAAGAGGQVGSVVPGIGTAIGAGVGAATYASYELVKAAMSKKTMSRNVTLPAIRDGQYKISKIGKGKIATLALGKKGLGVTAVTMEEKGQSTSLGGRLEAVSELTSQNNKGVLKGLGFDIDAQSEGTKTTLGLLGATIFSPVTMAVQGASFIYNFVTFEDQLESQRKQISENSKQILDQIGGINTPHDWEDPSATQTLYFTTLGEIIALLKRFKEVNDNVSFVVGGYLMDASVTGGQAIMVNLLDLPISLASLSKFLADNVNTKKSMIYDSDVFLRDIFENLIKKIINDGETLSTSSEKTAPRNIKMAVDITSGKLEGTNIDILNQGTTDAFIREIAIRKNKLFNAFTKRPTTSVKKLYKLVTTEEVKNYDYYRHFSETMVKSGASSARFLFNSLRFQEFINLTHRIPCILFRRVSDTESILKKRYMQFSRIDNPNLNTGQFLNSSGFLRLPYQFSAEFKPFMTFFMDIGSYIFIAPPLTAGSSNKSNTFGFGGLYMINGAELEYSFQRIQNGDITLPNHESKLILKGYMLSHGDAIMSDGASTENGSGDCAPPAEPAKPKEATPEETTLDPVTGKPILPPKKDEKPKESETTKESAKTDTKTDSKQAPKPSDDSKAAAKSAKDPVKAAEPEKPTKK